MLLNRVSKIHRFMVINTPTWKSVIIFALLFVVLQLVLLLREQAQLIEALRFREQASEHSNYSVVQVQTTQMSGSGFDGMNLIVQMIGQVVPQMLNHYHQSGNIGPIYVNTPASYHIYPNENSLLSPDLFQE